MEGCFIDYCQLSYRSFEAFLLFYKSFEGYEEEIAQNGKMFSGALFSCRCFHWSQNWFSVKRLRMQVNMPECRHCLKCG